jgi:hypothetical protein
MSLDVTLTQRGTKILKYSSGIFIRENGETKEITAEEWYKTHIDRDPVRLIELETETNEVYTANITHNLNKMAEEVGIYKHLWRPEEINITKAKELIDPLREGLHRLKLDPERYKKFDSENGWGTYELFIKFVENYLNACYKYPESEISVSR